MWLKLPRAIVKEHSGDKVYIYSVYIKPIARYVSLEFVDDRFRVLEAKHEKDMRYQLTQKESLYHLCRRTNGAHMIVSIIVIKPMAQYITLRIALESIVSRFCARYELTLKSYK